MFFLNKKIKSLNNKKAFSLVELLVTISILVVISSILFLNHTQFNSSILLENLAYEVSLTIRQAQAYGINVRQSGGSFDEAYGVFFNKNFNEFLIFADTYPVDSPNLIYDADQDEIVDRLGVARGNKIETLCAGSDCEIDSLNISFVRPDPSAIIKVGSQEYETAEIIILSPKGERKSVFVNKVGQITVK